MIRNIVKLKQRHKEIKRQCDASEDDFAQKEGHTLVIISADHETGGVTIVDGDMQSHLVKVNFSSKDHTAVMVPVYAYGPGADEFTGIYDNTEIFQKILKSFRFEK